MTTLNKKFKQACVLLASLILPTIITTKTNAMVGVPVKLKPKIYRVSTTSRTTRNPTVHSKTKFVLIKPLEYDITGNQTNRLTLTLNKKLHTGGVSGGNVRALVNKFESHKTKTPRTQTNPSRNKVNNLVKFFESK